VWPRRPVLLSSSSSADEGGDRRRCQRRCRRPPLRGVDRSRVSSAAGQVPKAKSIGDTFEAFVEWSYSEEPPRLVRKIVPSERIAVHIRLAGEPRSSLTRGGRGRRRMAAAADTTPERAMTLFVEPAQARPQGLHSSLHGAVGRRCGRSNEAGLWGPPLLRPATESRLKRPNRDSKGRGFR